MTLDEALVIQEGPSPDFVALDVALTTLEKLDPRQCKIVELRFFGGLSVEEKEVIANACERLHRHVEAGPSEAALAVNGTRPEA